MRSAPDMTADEVLGLTEAALCQRPKWQLLEMLVLVREQLVQERQLHRQEIAQLRERLAHEVRERDKAKQREINQTVNQPSSKKPEWDKAASPKRRRKRLGSMKVSRK